VLKSLVHEPNTPAADDLVVVLALEARNLVFVLIEPLEDPNLCVPSSDSVLADGALIYLGQREELRAAVATVVLMDLDDVIHSTTSREVVELSESADERLLILCENFV
jgi:hypothetical protein